MMKAHNNRVNSDSIKAAPLRYAPLCRLHGIMECWVYLMNHDIFQCDAIHQTQYSGTPPFHHSNGERGEISSLRY